MDDLPLGALFAILAVLLVFSGFFSSSETSMMALNRYRLNHLVRKGNKSAKLTAKLLAHTDRLLGSILFGNTLLNVAAATLAEIIVMRMFRATTRHSCWARWRSPSCCWYSAKSCPR